MQKNGDKYKISSVYIAAKKKTNNNNAKNKDLRKSLDNDQNKLY